MTASGMSENYPNNHKKKQFKEVGNLSLLSVCKQKQHLRGSEKYFFFLFLDICSLHHKHVT